MGDWNDFMQSKPVRIALNGLCALICAVYAVNGAIELVRPNDQSVLLMDALGTGGYYALTVVRIAVCAWVSVVFGRMVYKTLRGEDEH